MENVFRILQIEDDEFDRLSFRRSLRAANINAEVCTAEDDKTALALLKKQEFDCIFLDYLLPGTDGLSLLKQIRQTDNFTPIVVVTSQGDQNLAVEMMKAGAMDYITKKLLTPDGLSQTIRNIIRIQESEKQRKETEEALMISQARLMEAQRIAHIGNWEFFCTSFDIYWSDEVYNIFSVDKDTFVASYRKALEAIHPEDRRKIHASIREAKPSGRFNFDFRIIKPNGEYLFAYSQGHVVYESDGKIKKIIGTVQDVTKWKTVESELRRNKILAEESVKVKEQFLANMSHEIRTPMNGIIGLSSLMLNSEMNQEQREYVSAIKASGDNLLVIINDILDFSKLEAGKMTFEKASFNLKETIKFILEILKPKAIQKGILLESIVDSSLPEFIVGDSVRLSQILMNLIGNAIKFTEQGSVALKVNILNEGTEDMELEFLVRDTGIGIPEDKKDSIFESFTQASNNTTRKFGGTGLGLTITKKLVELQDGKIWVDSRINEGSVFGFSLKFFRKTSKREGGEGHLDAADSIEFLKGLKVLLVEDNPINQLVAKKVLDNVGCKVVSAENGRIAIEKLHAGTYDIILMDIQMPEMDGYQATEYIRHRMEYPKRDIPILALTASALNGESKRCFEAGMNDYISKPYNSNSLYAKMASLVRKKQIENDAMKILDESGESVLRLCNLDYLYQLSDGSPDFVLEMIQMFVSQVPPAIQEMKLAFPEKDWVKIKNIAHRLKPSPGFIGVQEMSGIFQSIEKNSSDIINEAIIEEMIIKAEKMTDRVVKELEEELTRLRHAKAA